MNLHRLAQRNTMCWLEWLRVCACSWVNIVGLRLTPNRLQRYRRHRRTKSYIFNHESRALPVLLPHTRPLRHSVVVVVSGIQPTPIAWEIIISSGAGNHCEKSRDDSVYKPMTTDGDFLLRFLSKHKNLLLIFKLNKKKNGVYVIIWI